MYIKNILKNISIQIYIIYEIYVIRGWIHLGFSDLHFIWRDEEGLWMCVDVDVRELTNRGVNDLMQRGGPLPLRPLTPLPRGHGPGGRTSGTCSAPACSAPRTRPERSSASRTGSSLFERKCKYRACARERFEGPFPPRALPNVAQVAPIWEKAIRMPRESRLNRHQRFETLLKLHVFIGRCGTGGKKYL